MKTITIHSHLNCSHELNIFFFSLSHSNSPTLELVFIHFRMLFSLVWSRLSGFFFFECHQSPERRWGQTIEYCMDWWNKYSIRRYYRQHESLKKIIQQSLCIVLGGILKDSWDISDLRIDVDNIDHMQNILSHITTDIRANRCRYRTITE